MGKNNLCYQKPRLIKFNADITNQYCTDGSAAAFADPCENGAWFGLSVCSATGSSAAGGCNSGPSNTTNRCTPGSGVTGGWCASGGSGEGSVGGCASGSGPVV